MNKKFMYAGIGIVLVIGVLVILNFLNEGINPTIYGTSISTTTGVEDSSQNTPTRILLSSSEFPNIGKDVALAQTYTVPNSGKVISFKENSTQSRNPSEYVLLD